MAHIRQRGASSGVRKAPRSLWERAGAQAGDGAGALFARLDAQAAQDTDDTAVAQPEAPLARVAALRPAHEQGAQALERVAAEIRAGVWNAAVAALVADALDALEALAARTGNHATGLTPAERERR